MADYSAIMDWVTVLLGEIADPLVSALVDKYAQSAIDTLIDVYPDLGSYDALVTAGGADLRFFNEGIGHLIAIRLRPTRPQTQILGEMTLRKAGDQEERYSPPAARKKTLEEEWMEAALYALGRVGVIKRAIAARAAGFNTFIVTGPTRTARENGYTPTLLSSVMRLLSQEAADDLESDL